VQVEVNYFYSKLTDIILQNKKYTPAMYDNLGEAKMQGVEFEGKYYINKSIFISGSMYDRTINDTSGNKNICPIGKFLG